MTKKCKLIAKKDQQALFRQKTADTIDFANAKTKLQYDNKHNPLKFKVENTIDFANAKTKLQYDNKHNPLKFKVENKTYFWLH